MPLGAARFGLGGVADLGKLESKDDKQIMSMSKLKSAIEKGKLHNYIFNPNSNSNNFFQDVMK